MCDSQPDQLIASVTVPKETPNTLVNNKVIDQAINALDAVKLIQLGARAALVCQLTGLSRNVVSSLYPPLTGTNSPPGQVPFTDTWYLKNNQRMLHANVIWRLYQQLGGIRQSEGRVLIHVYETYTQIVDAPLLNLTRAFFVPRLVTINAWFEQTCDHCGIRYIGLLGNKDSTCPACVEYFRYRCRSCGSAIEYCAVGRRRGSCSRCNENQKPGKQQQTLGGFGGCQEP